MSPMIYRRLVSLLFVCALCAHADPAQDALRAFKDAMRSQMIAQLRHTPKGAIVQFHLSSGRIVEGRYGGYKGYDDQVWLKRNHHWFAEAYGVDEILAANIVVRRAV